MKVRISGKRHGEAFEPFCYELYTGEVIGDMDDVRLARLLADALSQHFDERIGPVGRDDAGTASAEALLKQFGFSELAVGYDTTMSESARAHHRH